MKKLSLKLDDLQVDTFQTMPAQKARGTVFGEQCTCWTYCGQNTCPGCPTCDETCAASCGGTCGQLTCADAQSCQYTGCGADCPTNYWYNTQCYDP